MRSDLTPVPSPDDAGRIIDLGAVRRRRNRRRSPDGFYIAVLGLFAAFFWAVWLAVLFNLYPTKLLSYIAFLAPLWCAVASTGAIGAYLTEIKREGFADLAVAARRGAIVASIAIVNLAFLFAHRWTWPVAALAIVIGAGIEVAYDRGAA